VQEAGRVEGHCCCGFHFFLGGILVLVFGLGFWVMRFGWGERTGWTWRGEVVFGVR
jgi:hypothetical protein